MTAHVAPRLPSVRLRPLLLTDKIAVRRWMADLDVITFTVVVPTTDHGPVEPYSTHDADAYLDTLVRAPGRRSYAIETDGVHVGNVGLKDYDAARTSAECFIEIGEAHARGRGVGRTAMALLLAHAFGALALREVTLGVFEFNRAAISMYTRLGFVFDGSYGVHHVSGRSWRILAMRILAAGWCENNTP